MAILTDIPHFDLPFRYDGAAPVVAEQDSLPDIVNCVKALLLTQIGQRVEVPGFGINQPLFQQQPVDLNEVLTQLNQYEPRADVLMSQHPDVFDALVADIVINVRKGGAL